MKKKILSTLLFMMLFASAKAQVIEFHYPQDPTISRFQGWTGYLAPGIAGKLKLQSVRVYVNGVDDTKGLKVEPDPDSGAWVLNYEPTSPLPVGKVQVQFLAYATNGSLFDQRFAYTVDPSFDPDLQGAVEAVKENPASSAAHYELGQLYETKRLFRDAAYEYQRAFHFDPDNAQAREAYDRIFAMWGEKSLEQEHVRVDVALDDSLYSMGGPVAFEVKVTNEGASPISVDPKESVFIDSQGHQVFPLDDLSDYVQSEVDEKSISLDQYAQLSYFMDSHPMNLLDSGTLHASTTVDGYLAFPKPTGDNHKFAFIFAGVTVEGKALSFRFPFLLP